MAERLLPTKYQLPSIRPDHVRRRQLLDVLERAAHRAASLTLVSAPPGYGKTSIVAAWLASAGPACAWLSLDAGDNDPARLAAYLGAALARVDPDLSAAIARLLESGHPAPLTAAVNEFVAAGAERSAPLTLVLDDYHVVYAPAIHDAIALLIAQQPPALHLVVITRQDPPWPLARLRAAGRLTEVRAADLRFRPDETTAFFAQSIGDTLTGEAIAAMEAKTEGWIAGLQLAALAVQASAADSATVDHFVQEFSGSHRFIVDYLVDEVLRRQPPAVTEFLRNTALLDRFNASLCTAVTGVDDAQAILAYLERTNLFLVPLDAEREWYRYHHLLADVLRADVTTAAARAVRQRAAAWLAAHDFRPEAVEMLLAAGDFAPARELIIDQVGELMRRGEMITLQRWLDTLPAADFAHDPELLAVRLTALLLSGDIPAAARQLGITGRVASAQPIDQRNGKMLAVLAWLDALAAGPDTRGLAAAALDALPAEESFFRSFALIAYGAGLMHAGEFAASTRAFEEAYRLAQADGHPFAALGALTNLAYNLVDGGEIRKAAALCDDAIAAHTDRHGRVNPMAGFLLIVLGTIHYANDDLDRAEHLARRGRELVQTLMSAAVAGANAEQTLAEVAWARGQAEEALAIVRAARRNASTQGVDLVTFRMAMLEATFLLRRRELDAAARCLRAVEAYAAIAPANVAHMVASVEARLLVQRGEPVAALERLAGAVADNRRQGAHARLLILLLLQATANDAAGRPAEAAQSLAEAIALAAPEGYRRLVLREMSDIAHLLPTVRNVAPAYVDDLLARLHGPSPGDTPSVAPAQSPPALIEPLSEQEQNVLRLLAEGATNARIADALVITTGTAKWHVHNILGKLNAANRTEAVARARALGLI